MINKQAQQIESLCKVGKIICSNKLLCMNTHKLKDFQACPRLYFWTHVMNLRTKTIPLYFWFGSLVHRAKELLNEYRDIKAIYAAVDELNIKIQNEYVIPDRVKEEVSVQYAIIKLIIKIYLKYQVNKNRKLIDNEIKFKKRLVDNIIYTGSIDGLFQSGNDLILSELKTYSRVTNDTFKQLQFDKQINSYAMGINEIKGRYPKYCDYIIFRKPQNYLKANESIQDFIKRLQETITNKLEYYFIPYRFRFVPNQIKRVVNDLKLFTKMINWFYDCSDDDFYSLSHWPRNDNQCHNYGTCSYFPLCANEKNWNLYLPMFQMRDIRYDEEIEELDFNHILSVKRETKIKMPPSTKKLKLKHKLVRKK